MTAQAVVTAMKAIFARHGIPEELVSDGGPPFNSESVQKFFKKWNVLHQITSPHFPRANGQVERAVQTLKNSLTKAEEDGKDLFVVLLDYRIQPSTDLPSPAELLMGRRLRFFLPSHPDRFKPKFPIKKAKASLKKRQETQNKYANRNAIQLPKLQNNAKVWFRHKLNEPWKQGTIVQIGLQPRSYIIKGEDGRIYRRNRFYVRPNTCISQDNNLTVSARTVEDFYPSFNVEQPSTLVPKNNHSEGQPSTSFNQTIRKSSRNIVKPHRYRDI